MNAPVKIPAPRDQYIPQVSQFVPGCEGREMELRCSILLMRDKATSSMRGCSDEAHDVLQTVIRLASEFAFASMPLAELERLRYVLLRLIGSASDLEMFAYHRVFPSGGTDAGG